MKKLLISFSLLIATIVNAQEILQGVVAEENDKGVITPLFGANVFWRDTTIGTITDTSGVFSIPCLHEFHPLVISFVGHEPDTVWIKSHDFISVILKHATELKEVEISYHKKSTEISYVDPIKTQQISQKELFKAACCNLSESFETTPSVDVAFTDAITGTRQIQMLGLASAYTLVTKENIPFVRGLAAGQGFTYIPGTWISSIQLSKGTGSVVNGSESIAGQINVELEKPRENEPNLLNVYLNQEGRAEINLNLFNEVGAKWHTATLIHTHGKPFKVDSNDDGFLDFPRKYMVTAVHRWQFENHKGLESDFGVQGLRQDETGGQKNFNRSEPRDTLHPYGVKITTSRMDAFGKIGYVFPQKRYKSFGLQLSGSWHDMDSYFGLRDYAATEYSLYSNFIYQSIISSTNHKFKTGASFTYDHYDERLDSLNFDRIEYEPGAFFEYTYTHLENITIVAGGRIDYNSDFGFFATPRLHARFVLTENTVLRISAGSGHRTANIIAENIGLLATSRAMRIISNEDNDNYLLDPEIAWNYGASVTQNFKLGKRNGTFTADYFRTDFQDQVVVDLDDNPQEVLFYNLNGRSYSNSLQAQLDIEVLSRFDVRLSYRWYDVKTAYTKRLLEKPLVSGHRAFANFAYETKKTGRSWKFDLTVQWQGKKRIPYSASNPEQYRLEEYSPQFFLINAQIGKAFKKGIEIYFGVENLFDYVQKDPILASDLPYSKYFDSSMVWGPIFGRTTYAGFRYNFHWKHETE